MKKRVLSLTLAVLMIMSMCVVVTAKDHVVYKDQADTMAFNQDTDKHLNASYNATQPGQYLLLVLKRKVNDEGKLVDNSGNVLTDTGIASINPEDILYIDQTAAGTDKVVSFSKIYPKRIADSAVYLTGPDGTKLLGTINSGGMLGDVSSDEVVNFIDAGMILQNEVGMPMPEQFNVEVGDVGGDASVNFIDAGMILQYEVGMLAKLPNE